MAKNNKPKTKKKKSPSKIQSAEQDEECTCNIVDLHVFGLFDLEKNEIIKISLDQEDIEMDMALDGGLPEHIVEVEFETQVHL